MSTITNIHINFKKSPKVAKHINSYAHTLTHVSIYKKKTKIQYIPIKDHPTNFHCGCNLTTLQELLKPITASAIPILNV